jgi:hypothetical protein
MSSHISVYWVIQNRHVVFKVGICVDSLLTYLGSREMLWVYRVSKPYPTTEPENSIDVLAKQHYSVMQDIAENLYSPIGLLDVDTRQILGFDIDMMDAEISGMPPLVDPLTL